MFIEKEEVFTAIDEYQLPTLPAGGLDNVAVRLAILAAIDEATSYLNAKYDCTAIFSAQGEARNILLVEHCKSIAVWYLLKKSNTDILFERVKEYYKAAIDWLKQVAGVDPDGRTLAPILPLRREEGEVKTRTRYGSKAKFVHDFDD